MDIKNMCANYPVYREVDVVVVGGGTAEVVAALAAARQGAETVILERSCALGGNMTQGMVQSLHGYRLHAGDYQSCTPTSDWSNEQIVKNHLTMEVFRRLQDGGGTAFAKEHYNDPSMRENIDEEAFTYILDQMMKETGVRVLFDTYAFDALMDGNKIIGVIFANKSGPQIIKAKRVVDCSGDGDIAVRAGAEYELGDEDHRSNGISMMMEIGGIDIDKFMNYLENRPLQTEEQRKQSHQDFIDYINGGSETPDTKFSADGTKHGRFHMEGKRLTWDEQRQAKEDGKFLVFKNYLRDEWVQYCKDHPYPETPYMMNTTLEKPMYPIPPRFTWYGLVRNGKVRYDQTQEGAFEIIVNYTDGEELSEAIMLGREINWAQMKFLRERIPGFEDAYIIKTSPLYGGRESRRIIGEYVLTLEDVEEGRQADDVIAYGGFNNVHFRNGQLGSMWFIEPKRPFAIPYRCLVPKGIDNLLVGGRCYSHVSDIRNTGMPTCNVYGEAAGTAAALSIKENVSPRDINVSKLQELIGVEKRCDT